MPGTAKRRWDETGVGVKVFIGSDIDQDRALGGADQAQQLVRCDGVD
jgi:hypothetical protein